MSRKPQTHFILLAMGSVIAALMVGCGNDAGKHGARIARDLSPMKGGKVNPDASDPKVSAALQSIMDEGQAMHSGTTISTADLAAGTYILGNLSADFYYQDSKTKFALRAIHKTDVHTQTTGFTFDNSTTEAPQAAGSLPTGVTDSGRQLDFPTQFTVTAPANGKTWVPTGTQLTDNGLGVKDALTSNAGKTFLLTDVPAVAGSKTSVMNILSTVQVDGTGTYASQDDKNVPIKLTIVKLADNKTTRIIVSFEEQTASTANSTKATATVSEVRNIYLDYTLKP